LGTHAMLVGGAIGTNVGNPGDVAHMVHSEGAAHISTVGFLGVMLVFMRAFSLGGGTFTGIEAVSNGIGIMREPRVRTAKRTMMLMATSLAITAGGIILCYLLVHALPEEGKTMNAVLLERVAGGWHLGSFNIG